ncbi:MAG: glycosyltransferase family 4 protein [Prevotella sp.]
MTSKQQLSEYDIIHAHSLGPMAWLVRHGKVVNGVGKRIPLVTTLHCYCFQDFTDLYGHLKGFLLGVLYITLARRFDKVVCLSKSMMSYYSRWIPRHRLTFVYNTRIMPRVLPPIEEYLRTRLLAFKGNSTLVGMNGALIYRKGVDLMLGAIAELSHEGKDFRLVLAGDGKERLTFERMAKEKGIFDRVLFLGMVKDAWRLLPMYDVFALPSRSEGFPLALLEAGAVGIETVVSDLPIVKECFVNHHDVEMFKLTDGADGLKRALLYASASGKEKENIKKSFNSKYSPEKFYEAYLKVYY